MGRSNVAAALERAVAASLADDDQPFVVSPARAVGLALPVALTSAGQGRELGARLLRLGQR